MPAIPDDELNRLKSRIESFENYDDETECDWDAIHNDVKETIEIFYDFSHVIDVESATYDVTMNRLRFQDFQKLKSGRDMYSRVKLDELTTMVPLEDLQTIEAEFEFDEFGHYAKHRASCLRWMLRGLTVDKAIRKVKTDLEIMDHAIDAKRNRMDGDFNELKDFLAEQEWAA